MTNFNHFGYRRHYQNGLLEIFFHTAGYRPYKMTLKGDAAVNYAQKLVICRFYYLEIER